MERIGKYEIIREIGRGAMGRVLLARHPIMDKTVAIKVVHAPELNDPAHVDQLRRRLFDEARRAGSLSHPNIITIYDVDSVGELAYIVMEFIDGDTLEDRLAPGVPVPFDLSVSIIGQIASALDTAHARGIIHRDIKPANIMLSEGSRVKVADFGIAKNLAESGMTKTGLVLGTPYYMAPEQIIGKPIDGRADQFALAVIAYRMLTGVRPFEGDTVTAIMYQIVNGRPKSMLECNGELRPPTALIVEKALSKDPSERYATCSEFAHALGTGAAPAAAPPRPFIATQVVTGRTSAAAAPALAPTPPLAPAPLPPVVAAPRPARAWNVVRSFLYFVLTVAILGAAGIIYIAKQREAKQTDTQPAAVQPQVQPAQTQRVTAPPKARPRRVSKRSTPAAAKEEPAVELIDDTKAAAPTVPRVFDKR